MLIEHHIENRAHARLCDSMPASGTGVSSEAWFALRDARKDATLCPDCQNQVNSRDVRSELYGMGRHTTDRLYAVPVLVAFDEIRNCSHCRRNTDDNCKAWREAREAVAVLKQESRRLAKGVDELRDATGGRTRRISGLLDDRKGTFSDVADFGTPFCQAAADWWVPHRARTGLPCLHLQWIKEPLSATGGTMPCTKLRGSPLIIVSG